MRHELAHFLAYEMAEDFPLNDHPKLALSRTGGQVETWGQIPRKEVHNAEVHIIIPTGVSCGSGSVSPQWWQAIGGDSTWPRRVSRVVAPLVRQEETDRGQREGLTTAEREELRRLRRENRILHEERRF